MLSTLKDNSIKYPVMNLIAAAIGFKSVRNIVVSIYPIDNQRREKKMTQITVHLVASFVLIMWGVLLKTQI
jgi:hypothetical protein